MKNSHKKLTFVLFLSAMSIVASAQFRLGVKGGANYSDLSTAGMTTDLIGEVNAITSWHAGAVFQYKIFDFVIQPELLFSVQGGDLLNEPYPDGSAPLRELVGTGTTVAYRSQNLMLPINLQYGREFGKFRVYVQAGPYLNYLLYGTIDGSVDTWEDVNDKWDFNRFTLGFGFGAGAEIKGFQVSLRYDFDGNEIGEKGTNAHVSTNINPFYDMKERNLGVSVGYLF
jgi:hypothetical protein